MRYSFYFDKDLNYLISEELKYHNEYLAKRYAKSRLRMYANLFNRKARKHLLKENSVCNYCNSKYELELDHIIPISKGGKNELCNIQILCSKCNRLKS